jgi:hypothetical protein
MIFLIIPQAAALMTSVNILRDASAAVAAGVVTDTAFYSLDSYKILQQRQKQPLQQNAVTFRSLHRGLGVVLVTGTLPSYGAFFSIYPFVKSQLYPNYDESHAVMASSAIAGFCSSLCGVPSDVIKKRMIVEQELSAVQIVRANISTKGYAGGLFLGWKANAIRDVPFTVLKLWSYEGIAKLYVTYARGDTRNHNNNNMGSVFDVLTPLEAAGIGGLSGALTAILTNPMDVVNTRLKLAEGTKTHTFTTITREIAHKEGLRFLFSSGIIPRSCILSVGSTLFWSMFQIARSLL